MRQPSKFFKEKDYFGYKADRIVFFKQDMAPACDFNGKLYMEGKGTDIHLAQRQRRMVFFDGPRRTG